MPFFVVVAPPSPGGYPRICGDKCSVASRACKRHRRWLNQGPRVRSASHRPIPIRDAIRVSVVSVGGRLLPGHHCVQGLRRHRVPQGDEPRPPGLLGRFMCLWGA